MEQIPDFSPDCSSTDASFWDPCDDGHVRISNMNDASVGVKLLPGGRIVPDREPIGSSLYDVILQHGESFSIEVPSNLGLTILKYFITKSSDRSFRVIKQFL